MTWPTAPFVVPHLLVYALGLTPHFFTLPLTPQRYHEGSGCDTPVTLVLNSTIVAASCVDLDSVPVPRVYKLIFAYDLDPNVLGCFLAFRRPGGTLTQAVPPNGRHTAFACPSFAPHPTLPPPTIGLFYTDTVANQFTGVNGTLAVPGDETTACGNAVAGVPFTGPYLPFADDFSGPTSNVPKKDLWALDASSPRGAMRGGPGPATRQVRCVSTWANGHKLCACAGGVSTV